MKIAQITQKLKSSIKKRYVRKAEFESLNNEVKRLTKKLAKLEECCEAIQTEKPKSKVAEKNKLKAAAERYAPKAVENKAQKAADKTEPKVTEKKAATEPAETAADAKSAAPQDALTRIKGIGPVLEKKLHSLGVFRFSQIAGWNEEDIEKISEHLNFKGRVQREAWVQQAKGLE